MSPGHPNASVSAATTGLAALALYILHRFGYGHGVTAQDAVLGAGALVSAVLFVGRRGLKATILSLWRGSPAPATRLVYTAGNTGTLVPDATVTTVTAPFSPPPAA